MTTRTHTLLAAHGRLWYDDTLYRLSWIFGPQCLAIVMICWLFGAGPSPQSAPWGKPADPATEIKEFIALRDQAVSDRTAMTTLEARATAGNSNANFYLGTLYDPALKLSKIVSPDVDRSMGYYQVAMSAGDGPAQHNIVGFLAAGQYGRFDWNKACDTAVKPTNDPTGYVLRIRGNCYDSGWGSNPDNAVLAAVAFEAASKKGDMRATAALGYYYIVGKGNLPRNIETAVQLYKKAADQKDLLGIHNLAGCYDSGCGSLQKNSVEAARLISLALDNKYDFTVNTLNNRSGEYSAQFWGEMQKQLINRKLYNGPIDGKPSEAVLSAIKKWGGVN